MRGPLSGQGQLDWLLEAFLLQTPGVVHALVTSGDGLRIASDRQIDRELRDQLSAASAGLTSLANGVAQMIRLGGMTQTIIELEGGHLFVTQIGERATLVVVAARDCDMGMIGYEMTMLAAQVGHALTPVARLAPEWPPT
jgi:uncharacterized protein